MIYLEDDHALIDAKWIKTFFGKADPQYSALVNVPLTWVNRFEKLTLGEVNLPNVRTRGDLRQLCRLLDIRADPDYERAKSQEPEVVAIPTKVIKSCIDQLDERVRVEFSQDNHDMALRAVGELEAIRSEVKGILEVQLGGGPF